MVTQNGIQPDFFYAIIILIGDIKETRRIFLIRFIVSVY